MVVFFLSSSKEKLTLTNTLSTSFCKGSTDFASVVGSLFLCLSLGTCRPPGSTEDTFPSFQNFRHLLQIVTISREKIRIISNVTSGTFRRFRTVQWIRSPLLGQMWREVEDPTSISPTPLLKIRRISPADQMIPSLQLLHSIVE